MPFWSIVAFSIFLISPFELFAQCTISFTSDYTACTGTQQTLSATSTSADVTQHKWYTAATGGSGIATTTQFRTNPGGAWVSQLTTYFSSNTSYWVAPVCNGVESSTRYQTKITVNSGSNIVVAISPNGNPNNFCAGDNVQLTASGAINNSYSWSVGSPYSPSISSSNPFHPTTSGTYFATATNTCNTSTSSAGTPIAYNPNVGVPTISTSEVSFCQGTKLTSMFTASASNASGGYSWSVTGTGNTIVGGVVTWASSFSGTARITVIAYGCNGTWTTNFKDFVVYPLPNVVTTPASSVVVPFPSQTTSLSVPAVAGNLYQWFLDGVKISDGLSNAYSAQLSGDYKVLVTSSNGCKAPSAKVTVSFQNNYNYIIENTLLTSKNTSGTDVIEADVAALTADQRMQSINYFDGLGRLMQKTKVQGSPSKTDIVEPIVYDVYERPFREYQPFVAGSNGFYKVNPIKANGQYINDALNFYNVSTDNIADDTIPYAENQYEASPLNREYKRYGAGADWKQKKKSAKTRFLINKHGTASGEEKIIVWAISGGMPVRNTSFNGGFYRSNTLKIESKRDENGNETRIYNDRFGRMILKKNYVAFDTLALNNPNNWALTYYIYDDFGSLRYVLTPEISKLCLKIDTYTPSEGDIRKWAYRYVYDQRKRMTEKWIPGADVTYMAYDPRNRIAMTQDGAQRSKSPEEWTFTKYDALNRPIMTGTIQEYGSNWSLNFVQTYINDFYNKISQGNPDNSAWYEVPGTAIHGYTNKSFPTAVAAKDYLTVKYFDDYSFKSGWRRPNSYNYVSTDITGTITLQALPLANTNGVATGLKVRVLDGESYGELQWLNTINYYDYKGRLAQTITDNYKGGQDMVSTIYDFAGNVIKTKTTHVNRSVTWKNFKNASVEGNKVIKNSGAIDTWDSGAASLQVLPAGQNGWIEITASEYSYRMFGFSTQNPNGDPSLFAHGLILQAGGALVRAEGTSYVTVGNWEPGDTIRIERNGSLISYKRNSALQGATMPANAGALRAASVFYSIGSSIAYPKISFGNVTTSIVEEYEFDHALRPTNSWHQLGTNSRILLSRNNYNALGEKIEKRLHSTTTTATDAKETIDYRYNIRGWLTSINDPQVSTKLFAMNLKYNDPTTTGGPATYNGNISEIIWRNGGSYKQSYKYTYDSLNRLKEAIYYNLDSTKRNGRFTELIGGVAAKGYDLNGNILKLTRYGRVDEKSFNKVDDLKYYYKGNQLTRVDDAVSFNAMEQGFKELVKTTNEYSYDSSGRLAVDLNKGVTSIVYNYMNLPRKVTKNSTDYINYIYDAMGRKLFQQMYSATSNKRTDYVGEFVYQNDTLKFINTLEGRVVVTDPVPEYQYFLKDHLGNIRLTFSTKVEPAEVATATYEPANASAEQAKFLRLENARLVQSTLFDRTNGSAIGWSQRLSGATNEKYGIARSLSVMAGDVISAEVWAKYIDPANPTNTAAIQTLIAQLTAPATAPGIIVDGSWYSTSTTSFPFPGLVNTAGSTGGPKAYLNYLLFDRNFVFKTGGFKRLSAFPKEDGSDVAHERLFFDNIPVKEAGYIYIYISNEETSRVDVFFDDFKVTQSKSAIVQQDDYYPFGLAFNSYTRENAVKQDVRYNGKELQNELDLGWLDYGARMYMPELGRWGAIDPLSEKTRRFSPYAYGMDNPIRFLDPDGMSIDDFGNVTIAGYAGEEEGGYFSGGGIEKPGEPGPGPGSATPRHPTVEGDATSKKAETNVEKIERMRLIKFKQMQDAYAVFLANGGTLMDLAQMGYEVLPTHVQGQFFVFGKVSGVAGNVISLLAIAHEVKPGNEINAWSKLAEFAVTKIEGVGPALMVYSALKFLAGPELPEHVINLRKDSQAYGAESIKMRDAGFPGRAEELYNLSVKFENQAKNIENSIIKDNLDNDD